LQKHKYNLMGGRELMEFENQTQKNNVRWTASQMRNASETDWMDYFFRNAISQNHTLSFSSGSKNLSQFTSVGYTQHEGTLKNTDLKRFNFRSNINGKNDNGRLTYNTGITGNFSRSNQATNLGTGSVNLNPVISAMRGVPYFSPDQYDVNDPYGSIVRVYSASPNNSNLIKIAPLMIIDQLNYFKNYSDELKTILSGGLNYDLGKGFSIGSNLGIDYTDVKQIMFDSPYSFNSELFREANQEYVGFEREYNTRIVSFNSTSNLKWNKTFNEKHEVRAGAYLEYLKAHYNSSYLIQNGLDPYFSAPGSGTGWIGDGQDNDL